MNEFNLKGKLRTKEETLIYESFEKMADESGLDRDDFLNLVLRVTIRQRPLYEKEYHKLIKPK